MWLEGTGGVGQGVVQISPENYAGYYVKYTCWGVCAMSQGEVGAIEGFLGREDMWSGTGTAVL